MTTIRNIKTNNICVLFFALIFLFSACKKAPCSESFIPGEILLTFEESANLMETFELIDSFNLSILTLSNFDFTLNNNNTPLDTIINTFESKNYLTLISHTLTTGSQTTEFNLAFNNFDLVSNSDWFTTVALYQLTEKISNLAFMKFGTIKVPESEEDYWIGILKQHNNVTSASRNGHMCISYCQ
jgi:hypothetical protein